MGSCLLFTDKGVLVYQHMEGGVGLILFIFLHLLYSFLLFFYLLYSFILLCSIFFYSLVLTAGTSPASWGHDAREHDAQLLRAMMP